jgi:hypothetical protein
MKNKKWFYGLLATAFAFGLAGADIASAQSGVCGQGRGRGACMQADQSQATCPNYQQGRGRKRGQGRQQCLRGSNCPVTPANAAPATPPASAPSN